MTDCFFSIGKLSFLMDGGFGSSGKAKIASYITKNANNWQFACNAFGPQAGHTVIDNGKRYFYQTFNSCAYQDNYEKLYIGPGACIELPAFFREIDESNINPKKIGVHPLVTILQDKDAAYERGEVDLDGNPIKHEGTKKNGSTLHGVGANRARRILRRHDNILARDTSKLKEFLCNTSEEIMDRLDDGQSGLCEIAQGFPLSLMGDFFPHCTSRNVTVAATLDDMMIPPKYVGNVLLNLRTYPIRINSRKFICKESGKYLTWVEVQDYNKTGRQYDVYEGNSGGWYDDQQELTWDDITRLSGSKEKILEITSVTKLPRRVSTFSRKNLDDAIRHNMPPSNGAIFLSVNFSNYVDGDLLGTRSYSDLLKSPKMLTWIDDNIILSCKKFSSVDNNIIMKFVGTGPNTDDMIVL